MDDCGGGDDDDEPGGGMMILRGFEALWGIQLAD